MLAGEDGGFAVAGATRALGGTVADAKRHGVGLASLQRGGDDSLLNVPERLSEAMEGAQ